MQTVEETFEEWCEAEVQVHKNTAEVDEEPLLVGEELLIVDGKILETCVLCDNHEWMPVEVWEQEKDWLCGDCTETANMVCELDAASFDFVVHQLYAWKLELQFNNVLSGNDE